MSLAREAAGAVFVVLLLLAAGASAQDGYGARTMDVQGHRVVVDVTPATFRIDLPEDIGFGDRDEKPSAPVHPSLRAAAGVTPFPSMAVIEAAGKRFNDRLYATIELLLDRGIPDRLPGRSDFLDALRRALDVGQRGDASTEALARIIAALGLAGRTADAPGDLSSRVAALKDGFLADTGRSKPLGFYTTSRVLQDIFRRDRFLQGGADPRKPDGAWLSALGAALRNDGKLAAAYATYLDVAARLTNPLADSGLLEAEFDTAATAAVFPASRSLEGDLFRRVFGSRPIPPGSTLMDTFIAAIRKGDVTLGPRPESGWYDYQTWSLEPLIRPESGAEHGKIVRDAEYAKFCEEVFKACLTKRRETHVKQIEIPLVGAAMPRPPRRLEVAVRPEWSLEPQVTCLLRTAEGYAFVCDALARILGVEALRVTKLDGLGGEEGPPLFDALNAAELRHRRLAALAASEIGLPPGALGASVDAAAAAALAAEGRSEITALIAESGDDPRVMVPVAFNTETRRYRCWAIAGVAVRPAHVSWAKVPAVSVYGPDGSRLPDDAFDVKLEAAGRMLPYEVWIECEVRTPLDRAEWRALCDEHKTLVAIRAALEGR